MAETAYVPRLRTQYDERIKAGLAEQFGYKNVMQTPKLEKIVLNMGVGEAVRTTTAFITWPFLTRPRGIASLTDTTMMSPTEAYFRCEPPSTLRHITRRAPELSATSRFVCI